MKIDMWYNNDVKSVTKIDCSFSDLDCEYRGNLYINDKCVGDYSTQDSTEITKMFPFFKFA